MVTKGHRGWLTTYAMLKFVSVVLSLCFVYFSKRIVDIATTHASEQLFLMAFLIIGSVLLGIGFDQCASWISERVKIKMIAHLQTLLARIQMEAAWDVVKHRRTGDLQVRITSDVVEVAQMLSGTFPSFCVTGFRLLASLLFLWVMDPVLAVLVLAISPLLLFSKLYYRKMRALSKSVKQAESFSGTVLQENLKHRLLIRGLDLINVRNSLFIRIQNRVCRLKINRLRFSSQSQVMLKLAYNGSYLLAFLWGVYRLYIGQISFGTLTAFLQLVGHIQMPVITTIAFVPVAIRSLAATERLMELYGDKHEAKQKNLALKSLLCLRLDHLSFNYGGPSVITNLTARIYPGIPTAVVGATGKGKTTLIHLILGLIVPCKGSVSLESGGKDYYVSGDTRCNFSYVPQGNTLFGGSIRQNLTIVRPGASDEQLKYALHVACADFVYLLPEGLDTILGESGQGLSEGQAQRVTIARAVLRDAPVWLLDEATSALDITTTMRVLYNLLQAGRTKILIFVTHDPRVMGTCKQVIRLD